MKEKKIDTEDRAITHGRITMDVLRLVKKWENDKIDCYLSLFSNLAVALQLILVHSKDPAEAFSILGKACELASCLLEKEEIPKK